MMATMNLMENEPEQLELLLEEEEPIPSWGEIVRDPESMICLLYTSPSPRDS